MKKIICFNVVRSHRIIGKAFTMKTEVSWRRRNSASKPAINSCLSCQPATYHPPQPHEPISWNKSLDIKIAVVAQSLSCVWLLATPRAAAHQASLSFTVSWSLLKLMSIESVTLSNRLILYPYCYHSKQVYLLLPQDDLNNLPNSLSASGLTWLLCYKSYELIFRTL